MKPSTIAMDGPAASGKSTVAKLLADELGYLFFDTGVMYRAVTWATLNRGVDVRDETEVSKIAHHIQIDVVPASKDDGRVADILADGQDITWDIRLPEVAASVSEVSAYPDVRAALTVQQRRIGEQGNIVMVGRDIGTVVMPDADLKVFLDASVEERARRRFKESAERGDSVTYESVLAILTKRDKIDSTRDVAPLKAADDAVVIDSDQLSIQQVFEKMKDLVENWTP